MAAGDATAGDVPGRYDVVINGKGYRILDSIEPSLPFRSHRAVYGISPTFIARSNVSGAYGDNQQSFWLTFNQNDWGLGEQQRYFRPNGADADISKRRYWMGTNLEINNIQGQVSMQSATSSPSFGGSVIAACASVINPSNNLFAASSTNLYEIDNTGTVTDRGAHGAGSNVGPFSMVNDGFAVYLTGGTGVRKWNGSVFSTFSSVSTPSSLGYNNNTLYVATGGVQGHADTLQSLDTSGNATAIFTWKASDGTTLTPLTKLLGFGGDLLILRQFGLAGIGGELWIYDGNGVSLLASFQPNFFAYDMAIVNGVVMIAGSHVTVNQTLYQPAVYYYANGNIGLLWKANKPSTNLTHPTVTPWRSGLVIADESTGNLLFYDPASGGISTIGMFTTGSVANFNRTVGGISSLILTRNSATSTFFPTSSTATTATLTTSLYDFDTSLSKLFRGITVQFDSATDGNGGSVDIAYQLNSVDGAFTTLQVGAVSGTEYTLTNISGQSLTVKVTLNKGTSTAGPVLKRVYVRAAPVLQTYRFRTYVLDLSGIGWKDPVKLMDGTYHPLSGHEQASNLLTAFSATSPFTVTDRFSTFTGVCDISPSAANPAGGCEIYEMREGNDDPNFSGGFAAKVTIREV